MFLRNRKSGQVVVTRTFNHKLRLFPSARSHMVVCHALKAGLLLFMEFSQRAKVLLVITKCSWNQPLKILAWL